MKKKNVFIVHGYKAGPMDHWFQWLSQKLADYGCEVKVLALPEPSLPDPIAWQKNIEETLNPLQEEAIIVAHSLGCVASLNYLNTVLTNRLIEGMVLVSGFVSPLPALPELDGFVSPRIDYKRLAKAIPKRVVIGSPQDSIVPFEFTQDLAQKLNAELYPIMDGGHFLAEEGFESFPALLEILLEMFDQEPIHSV